jgi:hypothetical protein
MRLDNQELAYLIWILHFREEFTLKDISNVLKIPYWKVKSLASDFENYRLAKINHYQEKYALYERDQKRLKSLLWRLLAGVKLWVPSSESSLPTLEVKPKISPKFKQYFDRYVKRLDNMRKGKFKLTLKQVTPKSDPSDFMYGLLDRVLGNL